MYYEYYIDVRVLKDKERFKFYQDVVNNKDTSVASHMVIEKTISLFNKNYRYEDNKHPINGINVRSEDNINIGRE